MLAINGGSGSLTIKSGTVSTSGGWAVGTEGQSTKTYVQGGTLSGASAGLQISRGTVSVTSGTMKGTGRTPVSTVVERILMVIWLWVGGSATGSTHGLRWRTGTCRITGGTFRGNGGYGIYKDAGSMSISGASISGTSGARYNC